MAKATIVEIKPVKPEEKVVLELSVTEASLFYAVVASISATGKVGKLLGNIYYALKEIQRVKAYGDDIAIHICRGKYNRLTIADGTIPEGTIPEEK